MEWRDGVLVGTEPLKLCDCDHFRYMLTYRPERPTAEQIYEVMRKFDP
jgi:hypothetical protein